MRHSSAEHPVVSFIVPAYNEETLLGRTLDALKAVGASLRQSHEIVVSDDASTDRTASVAAEHGARVVACRHRQIAATRNSGARAARGEQFVFVDADTTVTHQAVHAAIAALRGGYVGGGAAVRFDDPVPFYAKLLLPLLVRTFRAAGWATGCFLFCTRTAFEAVGGFDETLYGAEEIVISRALGREGRFVVLREHVITSGRRLRLHSTAEQLRVLGRLFLRGSRIVREREGMDIWYDGRRDDPESNG